MNFRIVDLIVLTALVAVLFGAFQADLTYFRQLLFAFLVASGAFFACRSFSNGRSIVAVGAIGGLLGFLIYFVLQFALSEYIYGSWTNFSGQLIVAGGSAPSPNGEVLHGQTIEVVMFAMLAAFLGGSIGPLIFIGSLECDHEQREPIKQKQLRSWALFGGAMLFLFFSMIDRVNYMERQWTVLAAPLLFFFFVYTIGWTNAAHPRNGQGPEETETELASNAQAPDSLREQSSGSH